MTEEKDTTWKPGASGNPNGRPKGTGKPVSNLRSTLNKLKKLEPRSIDNIAAIVNGEVEKDEEGNIVNAIDKQMLETSKWVVATISSMTRAAISEEQLKHDMRVQAELKEAEENKKEGTSGNVITGKFTTRLVEDLGDEE